MDTMKYKCLAHRISIQSETNMEHKIYMSVPDNEVMPYCQLRSTEESNNFVSFPLTDTNYDNTFLCQKVNKACDITGAAKD